MSPSNRQGATAPKPHATVKLIVALLIALCLISCGLLPRKPSVVFVSYRDHMREGNVEEARKSLTSESRKMVVEMSRRYALKNPPENLAILNTLDPVSPPETVKVTQGGAATLRVRTLRGGVRLIKMKQEGERPKWKIDLTNELSELSSFLEVRRALNMIREQAGEYAATLKAFNEQIERFSEEEGAERP